MQDNMVDVGIDSVAIYIPKLYIELADEKDPERETEFSISRKTDPKKYLYGIGVSKIAMPDTYEDSVTMAANAIYELIRKNDISPKEIDRIDIASETAVDESKPIAAYVHGMLEKVLGKSSLKNCGAVDYKFACAGTGYALNDAVNWVLAGKSDDKCRIICATDIARYELYSNGEPTQGAAAIAFTVKRNPRLLTIDPVIGKYTEDEDDFWRPPSSKTAFVKGKHSIKCYLKAMREAFDNYAENAIENNFIKLREDEALTDHFDLIAYHTPFPKMVKYAASHLFRHEWRELSRWEIIEREIGKEPKKEQFKTNEEFERKDKEFGKKFSETELFKEAYGEKIADGLVAPREVGNCYTASVWLSLCSLLEVKDNKGENLSGKKGGIGFYGSGSTAIANSFIVQPEYKEVVRSFNLMKKIKNRISISLQDYENLHEGRPLSGNREHIIEPENEFILVEVTSQGYRYYDYV